jgi:hypothetical protein
VGKLGGDFDEWSSEQASVAWKEVGGMEGEEKVVVKREFRSTLVDTDVEKLLKDAGYDGPRSTKYVFCMRCSLFHSFSYRDAEL